MRRGYVVFTGKGWLLGRGGYREAVDTVKVRLPIEECGIAMHAGLSYLFYYIKINVCLFVTYSLLNHSSICGFLRGEAGTWTGG